MSESIKNCMDILSKAMKEDYEYAWGWHCSIAMALYDEGANHEQANKAASRFYLIRIKFIFNADRNHVQV